MKIRFFVLTVIVFLQHSVVSGQTALPDTGYHREVYLSYSTSDYTIHTGISTKTKGGLVCMGVGLLMGTIGIVQLKNDNDTNDDPFKDIITGASFFAVGTFVAISGGIRDLSRHYRHHSRWTVIGPGINEIGLACNF